VGVAGFIQSFSVALRKRGWLRTHLIANRRYIVAADVAEFMPNYDFQSIAL